MECSFIRITMSGPEILIQEWTTVCSDIRQMTCCSNSGQLDSSKQTEPGFTLGSVLQSHNSARTFGNRKSPSVRKENYEENTPVFCLSSKCRENSSPDLDPRGHSSDPLNSVAFALTANHGLWEVNVCGHDSRAKQPGAMGRRS